MIRRWHRWWQRWWRTPKALLLFLLLPLAGVAAFGTGWHTVAPGLFAAMLAAALLDLPLLRWRRGRWEFPDGALLTGLLIAMVLSPHQSWRIAAATSLVAIASKHALRYRTANLFNPAAFGLVVTFYALHTAQSWWGAMGELDSWSTAGFAAALAAVVAAGVFIAHRVNKLPMVLAFLSGFFALATLATSRDANGMAELFRYPDAPAALFFALFILTDPPTSPVRQRDQVIAGGLVAALGFIFLEWTGSACYLLAGVLAGNLWECARRALRDWRRRPAPAPLPAAASAYRGRGDWT